MSNNHCHRVTTQLQLIIIIIIIITITIITLKQSPGICLLLLSIITKNVSQRIRSCGPNLNPEPPEHKSALVPLRRSACTGGEISLPLQRNEHRSFYSHRTKAVPNLTYCTCENGKIVSRSVQYTFA